ncbi:TIGR00730 family Rossman fold protein [Candidatus Sumerlaeota bacterium]|nr:TIGR00730 family Rossman fold protein [Candidatus Sumerlaeota bacterium]
MKRLCVFCGSNDGEGAAYRHSAARLGRLIAGRGLGLVYGGGGTGLMGALADAALENGGEVIGVIPRALATKELAHPGLTQTRLVETMHERKALMEELSDGFIALPGGIGTLEEICEMLTWAQLGIHRKPCALLDVEGFFVHLIAFLDHASEQKFFLPQHRRLLIVETGPEALLAEFESYQPPPIQRWMDRATT